MRYDASPTSGLPTVVMNLLIINVLMFVLKLVHPLHMSGDDLDRILGLHLIGSPLFKPWQLVTHMFMHGSWFHLFFNMLALYMLGPRVEYRWGSQRFLTYYLACGLGAAVIYMGWQWYHIKDALAMVDPAGLDQVRDLLASRDLNGLDSLADPMLASIGAAWWVPMVGASGAIFGVLLAFGMLYPNVQLTTFIGFFPVPMKAKWFVIMYGAIELLYGLQNNPLDNTAHFAHVGGMISGFLLGALLGKEENQYFY